MKTTTLVKCSCPHSYQDEQHKGKRVANLVTKSIKSGVPSIDYRCTVCKKLHTVNKGNA